MNNRVPPFPPPLPPPQLPSSSSFVHTDHRSYPSPPAPIADGFHPQPTQHHRYGGYQAPGFGGSSGGSSSATITSYASNTERTSPRNGSGSAGVSVSDLCHPSSPPSALPLSMIVHNSDPPPARVSSINDLLHPSSPDVSPPSPRASVNPDPPVPALSHATQVPMPVLPPGPLPFYSMSGPYGITPPADTTAVYSNTHHHRLPGHRTSSASTQQAIRHKKEIKRRTKTGCITCRKRRIKCDEARPTCNNCRKSKRDCAGYPGFKPPPPLPITRTSHASSPLTPQSVDTGLPTTAGSSGADSSFDEPEDAEFAPATPRALAAALASSASPVSVAASLVPAPKAATAGTGAASTPSPDRSLSITPTQASWSVASSLPTLTSSVSSLNSSMASAPVSTSGSPRNADSHPPQPVAYSGIIQKQKMKVEDLIALGGPAPTQPSSVATHETADDITSVYYDVYVPGLSGFFETAWYNFKPRGSDNNPINILLENQRVMDLLASFLTAVGRVQSTDPKHPEMAAAAAQEPRVVWALASLVYTTPMAVNPPSDQPMPIDNAIEARNRVSVVDALLSGGSVRTNPCMRTPRSGNPLRIREHQFWWWLAEFLRLQDDPDAAPGGSSISSLAQMREQALSQMRNLLDGRENRDVIYAIATLRELAPRYATDPAGDLLAAQQQLATGRFPDESNPLSKYKLAANFIRSEAQDRGGTTNVLRRFAQLGFKAYLQPGSNIRRP